MIPLFDDMDLDRDCEVFRQSEELINKFACNDDDITGDDAA